MTSNLTTDANYLVVGNPIKHSKSPLIHQLFAKQTAQQLVYKAQLFELDCFSQSVDLFIEGGGLGMNVTVPFKQQAFEKADLLSPCATLAGAVNTLSFKDNLIHGDNTDGIGLVRDLTLNKQVAIKGKDILILGAGGAVRGVLEPIIAQQPASITIANRTLSKAQELVALFAAIYPIKAVEFGQLNSQYALVINGTSSSLQGQLPAVPAVIVNQQTVFYDMMYAKDQTLFNQWGAELGVSLTIDGLGMLIEQAAESFRIWRDVTPDTAQIIATIRSQL